MTKGPLNIIKNAKCNTAPTDTIANDINPSVIHNDGGEEALAAEEAKVAVKQATMTDRHCLRNVTHPSPIPPTPLTSACHSPAGKRLSGP